MDISDLERLVADPFNPPMDSANPPSPSPLVVYGSCCVVLATGLPIFGADTCMSERLGGGIERCSCDGPNHEEGISGFYM